MTVVHRPLPRHDCQPGWEWHPHSGDGPLGDRLTGHLIGNPPDPWRFPRGTVWACDCGQTWVSCGSPAPNMPGVCTFRREGRFERWRRERRYTRRNP